MNRCAIMPKCTCCWNPPRAAAACSWPRACRPDTLDGSWQRLILTHLAERTHAGVLTGAPLTDVKITLTAGRAHLKHTEGGDFRQATYRAVRQGLRTAARAGESAAAGTVVRAAPGAARRRCRAVR